MINQLREQNIKLLEKNIKSGNEKSVTMHRIIEQILKEDDCFKQLTVEKAAEILKILQVKDWKNVYVKLLNK